METSLSKTKTRSAADVPSRQQQLFVGVFAGMSMQLLFVVLIPFLGGHFIDQKLQTAPLFTLIGLGVALVAAGLTVWRAYKTVMQPADTKEAK